MKTTNTEAEVLMEAKLLMARLDVLVEYDAQLSRAAVEFNSLADKPLEAGISAVTSLRNILSFTEAATARAKERLDEITKAMIGPTSGSA